MDFEHLQAVWKQHQPAELFEVDEVALHALILRKNRTIANLLEASELILIVVNFGVGLIFFADLLRAENAQYPALWLVVTFYLAYAAYAFFQQLGRRATEARFPSTILGELDKGLWRLDYLIQLGRTIAARYVLPLVVVITVAVLTGLKPLWVLPVALTLVPLSYFGPRWEINNWYLPKKRTLEALRAELLARESE